MTNATQTRSEKRAAHVAHVARLNALQAAARVQVATGKCPDCGAGIHINNSLAGWWQCDRSGSGHFRRDITGAACQWQVFTE